MDSPTRVLVVAAAGHHCSIARHLAAHFDDCRVHYLTTRRTRPMVEGGRVLVVHERLGPPWLARPAVALQVLWVLAKVRPQFILAMDTVPGVFAVRFGRRLLGAMTHWLDDGGRPAPDEADMETDAGVWLTEATGLA